MNISIYYQKAGIMNVSNGSKASTRRVKVVGGFQARQLTYPRYFNIRYRVYPRDFNIRYRVSQ